MEWNRKIEDKLTENWQWLLRTVMLKDIIHVLIEDKIISLDYWMNLKEKQISEQDRNANFFFEISKFTKERYRLFIEALKKGSHNDLADILEIKQKEDYYKSNQRSNSLGPKNERIKKLEKGGKLPEHISKQDRSPSDIKRENSELRNQLTTITSHVGHLHNVTQTLTGPLKLTKDITFTAKTEKDTFVQRLQNVEEHEQYLELQETNLQQEMAIKHLRSELVEIKIELNHQINQLEIKLKDAHLKKELKEHEAENLLSKVTGMKTQMHSLAKDLDLEREEKSKLKVETTRLVKVNEELIQKIKEHNSNEISSRENVMQIKSERDSANSAVKSLDKSLVEKEQIIIDQKQKIENLTGDIGNANSRTEELVAENKQLKIKIKDIEKEILDLKLKLQKSENDKQRSKMKSSVVPSWR